MYIARILYPVEVLGPGKRVGIWFAGCPRRCKGCSNPELWERDERYHTSLATVMHLIDSIAKAHKIDGFTLTGGDPMLQYDAVMMLLPYLKAYSHDILVYTGYRYEELPENCRRYVEFIEEQIGFPVTMVSNGPGRDDIIYR